MHDVLRARISAAVLVAICGVLTLMVYLH